MPREDPPLFPYPESEIDRVLAVALPLEWNGFDDFVTEFEGPQVGATYIEVRELKVDTRPLLEVIKRIFRSPEVFLRELISNASDALGRFKLQSLGWHPELSVVLEIDKTEKTLSITDNGKGMTKADLKHELGTIGWSGTNKYREYLKLQELSDPSMIGEFGCCFFAAFLIAHKVQVFSKHDEDDNTCGLLYCHQGCPWRETCEGHQGHSFPKSRSDGVLGGGED